MAGRSPEGDDEQNSSINAHIEEGAPGGRVV
jgi:hypothetical protein